MRLFQTFHGRWTGLGVGRRLARAWNESRVIGIAEKLQTRACTARSRRRARIEAVVSLGYMCELTRQTDQPSGHNPDTSCRFMPRRLGPRLGDQPGLPNGARIGPVRQNRGAYARRAAPAQLSVTSARVARAEDHLHT